MADNVEADAGSGGATFATDDIGSVHFPRTKITLGADGVNDGDVASGNPMPITGSISGTVTANLGTVDNAVLDAIAASVAGTLTADVTGQGDVPVTLDGEAVTVNLGATDNAVLDSIDDAVNGTINVNGTVTANLGSTDNTVLDTISGNTASALTYLDTLSSDLSAIFGYQQIISGNASIQYATTLYKNIDVDESEDQVQGSETYIVWLHVMNLSSSVRYLKLYNALATNVTVGTTVPDLTFPIPTTGDTNGAGFTVSIPNSLPFTTALTIAATTGLADNDSGAPGANEVIVNMGYL